MIFKNISESTVMIPNVGSVEPGKTIEVGDEVAETIKSDVLVREGQATQPKPEVKPVAPTVNSGAGGDSVNAAPAVGGPN